jgi:hypothetical protein
MKKIIKIDFLKRKTPASLLGLALDEGQLEGVVLRRSNGSLQVEQKFTAALSLDLLTNDPELVGREILNQLETAGVRERHCVVGVPLKWTMAAHTTLPELPEADLASFLQIEAERGFPTDVATLQIATSQLVSASGARHATLVAVPRGHVERLEQVLRAAKLKPVSFSLGIAALQPAGAADAGGELALVIGANRVGLQITCGGGVAALRTLEGPVEVEGGRRILAADYIAREARITLGQLPADLRDAVKKIRIFGEREQAAKLAEEIRPRFEPAGLSVETVTAYSAAAFGRTIPPDTAVSPAFSLAARHLVELKDAFEFLPVKVSSWQQMTTKYASGKWRTVGTVAAAIVIVIIGLFAVQQWQLVRLRSRWTGMATKVKDLQGIQDQIQKYHAWYDTSFRYLSILRELTTAFPEDGSVTAKTLEIRAVTDTRDATTPADLNSVSCSGNAANYAALQKTVHQLGTLSGVSDLNVPTRGTEPIQFTFDFHLSGGGRP